MASPTSDSSESKSKAAAFAAGADRGGQGMMAEMWQFLRTNKKWWLTPVVVLLVLLAALIVLGGTGAAPFIYTLF